MAVGEADSKDHKLRGLLSQAKEKKLCVLEELKPAVRQVSLAPYDLFSTLSDFSFSMPGGWNDQDLAIFLESCWENVEDLRKQNVGDHSKWKQIAEAGARKSSNSSLFTINSCMEVAQCIKSYVIYNEKRLSNNESFKKFHNDVINLLPYFPPVTIAGTFSAINRSLANPVGGISEYMNGDDVLENTLSQLILQNLSVIQEGNSSIWEKLSKIVHDRISFNTDVQLFLELTKRKIISLVAKEADPQRKKEIFFQKAKQYMVEVFDYIAPLAVKKSDFFSPVENDSLVGGDNLPTRKRGIEESTVNANVLFAERVDVSPHLPSENISLPKKLKKECESGRGDEISEANTPEKCEIVLTDQALAQKDVSSNLNNILSVESNHKKELIESCRELKTVSEENQKPLEEPLPSAFADTVTSSLECPIVSPPEEATVITHSVIEPPTDKKRRKIKKKEKLMPSRELPPRTARPKASMKIKHKYINNQAIEKNSAPDGMETKETRKKVNKEESHEMKEIPTPTKPAITKAEVKGRETSVRVVEEVTTTHETILSTSNTLSRSENSTNCQRKPGVHSQTPQSKKHFLNKRIITEEKVTTVVAGFPPKKPIVKLIDICKDSNFKWPFQSQCTITTSDLSRNPNGVTFADFKAKEISASSRPKGKQKSVVESTKIRERIVNSSKLDNRRSDCEKMKSSKSQQISQKRGKSKFSIKTMVKPYNYETDSETPKIEISRPSRNRNGQSSVRDYSPGPSNSENVKDISSSNTLCENSMVLSNAQSEELNLCPESRQIQRQHPVTTVNSMERSSAYPFGLICTSWSRRWDQVNRGKSIDMKGTGVEGLLSRHTDPNKDHWFQNYRHDYNIRSSWRYQEMSHRLYAKTAEERKFIERFRNEILPSLQTSLDSLKK